MSIQKNIYGPLMPTGSIVVPTPGTAVGIMSVVDSTGVYAPNSTTNVGQSAVAARKISIQAKFANVGQIYVVVNAQGGTPGSKADTGTIIRILQKGDSFDIDCAALLLNGLNPYDIAIDVDTANDGAYGLLYIA